MSASRNNPWSVSGSKGWMVTRVTSSINNDQAAFLSVSSGSHSVPPIPKGMFTDTLVNLGWSFWAF